MQLIDQVRRFIRDHNLAAPQTRVVAAVSGGPDSTALAHLLHELDRAGELNLIALAHFNHQLRPDAAGDEAFCAALATRLHIEFVVDGADVRAASDREQRSIEHVAHNLRHDFFERVRRRMAAGAVAVAHTRDDQAETFLLRLLRGAGARGLAAMHPRHGSIVRPLLGSRRRDVHAYLDRQSVTFRRDASNDDLSIPRNRVRTELLPFIESKFNPSIVDVLADGAEIAREEWLWLEAGAEDLWRRTCRHQNTVWRLDAARLASAPAALARLVIHRAMTDASGGLSIPYAHVERVLRLCHRAEGSLDAPHQLVERLGPDVVLTGRGPEAAGRPERSSAAAVNRFSYSLSIPGEVIVAETGCTVSAEPAGSLAEAGAIVSNSAALASAVVPLSRCGPGLVVRNRRPGDRLRPLGLGGRKKLQDYFVDKKVVRAERDRIPLVVDSTDRIVWVGGHTVDEAFRVTDPAQAVLVLKLKQG